MNRREQILLVTFMLLAGIAAYLYLDDLVLRWNRWWAAEGPAVEERPLSRDRADRILEDATAHFFRSLARSLNLPDLREVLTGRRSLRYGGILAFRPAGRGDRRMFPMDDLTVRLSGTHGTDGVRVGTLRARVDPADGGETLVVQYRGDTVQMVFPERRAYFQPRAQQLQREALASMRRDTPVLTRWRGRPAVRIRWGAGPSRAVELYVAPRAPHAVLGSRYRSRERRVRHFVTYRDDPRPRRFDRFETRLDGQSVAEVRFLYREDRLHRLHLATPGLEGVRWLRLTMIQGGRHSRGGTVAVRSRWLGGRRRLGVLGWRFRDGLPSRFTLDADPAPTDGSGAGRLLLSLEKLRWDGPPPRVSLVSETGYRRLTRMQVLGRVMAWLGGGGDAASPPGSPDDPRGRPEGSRPGTSP